MEPNINRRQFLVTGALGLAAVGLAACSSPASPSFISPTGSAVAAHEARRRHTGAVVQRTLTAEPLTVDLGGRTTATWGYRGLSSAKPIRGNVGDVLKVELQNNLPDPTTVHWHGLALRNNMDGVPNVTQQAIPAGDAFTYEFALPAAGTHWFHPHVGTQTDRALYGPLIVDDPSERADYDREWILVLDDWLDGFGSTPDDVLKKLSKGMNDASMDMGGMDMGMKHMGNILMGAESEVLGGDAGDVYYPLYLINGKPSNDPESFSAKPGERIRLRIINAGSDTAFRFGVTGHNLTVTHTDGYPVEAAQAESLVLGMGERFDAIITAGNGVFAVIAEALGKQAQALAILRTGSGSVPSAKTKLPQRRRPTFAGDLKATAAVTLAKRAVDRKITLELTGNMSKYAWSINGKRMDLNNPLRDAHTIREGERVALEFKNSTRMWHPMHLHGHTYQHVNGGPRKDTSIVLPGQTVSTVFDADNPGRWITHCHNAYHAEAGMMAAIAYK